jgi:hypothetical protein
MEKVNIVFNREGNKIIKTTIDDGCQTDLKTPPYEFHDIEDNFKDFVDNNTNNSNIIDIIGIYIKGQKILYIEAKTTCEQRLTFLMIPSILFTVSCSILNLLLKDYFYGNVITSILNGVAAFILAVINYLKLDARAEAHRGSAYKYDKLLTYIEFQSYKQLFFTEVHEEMKDIIETIEKEIKEIKETNQFILPEIIRYNFPSLTNTNIFSEVKRIGNLEIIYKNRLTKIYNDIDKLEKRIKEKTTNSKDDTNNVNDDKMEKELIKLEQSRDMLTIDILSLQNEYITIDKEFKKELNNYSKRNMYKPRFFDWFKV